MRTEKQLERVLKEVEQAPGIVLYTVVKKELIEEIERRCRELKVPCLHVLEPIMKVFESYLGAPQTPIVAGQHLLDADYFARIDALNFAMAHDDGQLPQDLNRADIIILGISRTSKTPTSIYLAQRGYKTANLPLVPGIEPPAALSAAAYRLRGRPGRQRRAHRRDPPQPRAAHRRPQARRLCRPHPDHRGDPVLAPPVRPPRLARHRRDAPLGGGNRRHHHSPPARPARRAPATTEQQETGDG